MTMDADTEVSSAARQTVQAILANAGLNLPPAETAWLERAYVAWHAQMAALRLPDAELMPLEPAIRFDPRD